MKQLKESQGGLTYDEVIDSFLYARCIGHRHLPQLNKNENSGAECGVCCYEQGEQKDAERIKHLEQQRNHLQERNTELVEKNRRLEELLSRGLDANLKLSGSLVDLYDRMHGEIVKRDQDYKIRIEEARRESLSKEGKKEGVFYQDLSHLPIGISQMPNPTEEDLKSPAFEAIWQVIKHWDVNVPQYYSGYCGANGSHVMLILNALRKEANLGEEPIRQEPKA